MHVRKVMRPCNKRWCLRKRIKHLAIILVDQLKGKKAEEVEERLKKDVEQLERDLKYIQTKLEGIASQHTILILIFRRLNEEKVRKCVEYLSDALESFNLSRQVTDSNTLNTLVQQIITFRTEHQASLDDIRRTMKDVKAILVGKPLLLRGNTSEGSSHVIPIATKIFFGRDALVASFTHTLTSQRSPMARICLQGPGGMGKTSIALAVLHHPTVIDHFGIDNRIWVPCVKATSVSLFLDTLYASLSVSLSTGDALHDIITKLESSEPTILVLDNFETPWNSGKQSEVQEILLQLEKLPHVALFVTIRSSNPPGEGIEWECVHLEAVDKEASYSIYAAIDSAGSKDPQLSLLLEEVGHMPLAVTLMAQLGKKMGISPVELLELYKESGTALLGHAAESQRSMDTCIRLSVESQPMKDYPDAAKLLAILALLPTLLDTSLVEKRGNTFFVLPVIRSYVLNPVRFPEDVRTSIVQIACIFLKQHSASLGESSYMEHKLARSLEEMNLQATLLETTNPDPQVIQALLILSEHQCATRPRTEVVKHAVKLSKGAEDQKLYAESLHWYGRILYALDHYDKAMEQYQLSRELFFRASERKRAADVLYWIGRLEGYASTTSTTSTGYSYRLEDALAEFKSIGDCPEGIARCQTTLAYTTTNIQDCTENLEFCITNNLTLEKAECTLTLAKLYQRLKRYDEALKWGASALEEWKQICGWSQGALRMLGKASTSQGKYDKAMEYMIQALEEYRNFGSPLYIGATLLELGRIWMKKGSKEDARGAFMEAVKYYEMIQGSRYSPVVRVVCTFYLDKLENPSRKPSIAEAQALEKVWLKEDIV
ncbi:hypothetical protein BT96DRAFT_1024303 [Gymnopus androsaceus JB14]|uniref:NB-ARC domain-containing protein n=1 Tax=Gymnopus androsaceus JB14 TaxID=1447944 RepID=A0A6A4GZK9_9AGAR|nr:hypothetical protein BT96DRAFT_1024303 [Gymnopus androsaceus JB14]